MINIKLFNSINYRIKGLLFLVPIFLVVGLGLVVGSALDNDDIGKVYKIQNESVREVLGASVNNGSIELKVNSKTVQESKVTVNVSIKNNTSRVIEFSPGLSLKAIDAQGLSYFVTMQFMNPNIVIGGPIGSGNTMTLDVDFEIKNSVDLVKLVYQPDELSNLLELKL